MLVDLDVDICCGDMSQCCELAGPPGTFQLALDLDVGSRRSMTSHGTVSLTRALLSRHVTMAVYTCTVTPAGAGTRL